MKWQRLLQCSSQRRRRSRAARPAWMCCVAPLRTSGRVLVCWFLAPTQRACTPRPATRTSWSLTRDSRVLSLAWWHWLMLSRSAGLYATCKRCVPACTSACCTCMCICARISARPLFTTCQFFTTCQSFTTCQFSSAPTSTTARIQPLKAHSHHSAHRTRCTPLLCVTDPHSARAHNQI